MGGELQTQQRHTGKQDPVQEGLDALAKTWRRLGHGDVTLRASCSSSLPGGQKSPPAFESGPEWACPLALPHLIRLYRGLAWPSSSLGLVSLVLGRDLDDRIPSFACTV